MLHGVMFANTHFLSSGLSHANFNPPNSWAASRDSSVSVNENSQHVSNPPPPWNKSFQIFYFYFEKNGVQAQMKVKLAKKMILTRSDSNNNSLAVQSISILEGLFFIVMTEKSDFDLKKKSWQVLRPIWKIKVFDNSPKSPEIASKAIQDSQIVKNCWGSTIPPFFLSSVWEDAGRPEEVWQIGLGGSRGSHGATAVRCLQGDPAADEGQRDLPGGAEAQPEGGGETLLGAETCLLCYKEIIVCWRLWPHAAGMQPWTERQAHPKWFKWLECFSVTDVSHVKVCKLVVGKILPLTRATYEIWSAELKGMILILCQMHSGIICFWPTFAATFFGLFSCYPDTRFVLVNNMFVIFLDAEFERWGRRHAASGPAGGAVLSAAAAAVRHPGRGAALWGDAAHCSAAEHPQADGRWECSSLVDASKLTISFCNILQTSKYKIYLWVYFSPDNTFCVCLLQSNRTRWFTTTPLRVQMLWRVMRSLWVRHRRWGKMSFACCSREHGSWRPAGVASLPRKSTSRTRRWGCSLPGWDETSLLEHLWVAVVWSETPPDYRRSALPITTRRCSSGRVDTRRAALCRHCCRSEPTMQHSHSQKYQSKATTACEWNNCVITLLQW